MVNRRLFLTLIVSNFLLFFGFSIWMSIFNNFAVGEIGVRPEQIGLIQSLREIPGLLGFTFALLALLMPEMRIMAFSTIILGIGLMMTGHSNSVTTLLVATMATSVGFHYFYNGSSAVALLGSHTDQAPRVLGKINGVIAAASIAATGITALVVRHVGERSILNASGIALIVGGLVLMPFMKQPGRKALPRRSSMPIRRRYWLYYILTFLMGSRRHIASTFAIFLLVKEYGISTQQTALLYLVNSLINTYAGPQIGRLVARFGERRVLTINYILLIGIFLGYAYLPWLKVLYVLFIMDSVLGGVGIALSSYFKRIAVSPDDITGNVSVAQSINHISAVILPLAGGWVWALFGSQYTFLFGVGIVSLALVLTQLMRVSGGVERPVPALAP
ncbi:MAG: MFS transporter [Chloroflexi bacterium]|nr:MFS transporter [Chloroflexota bacterium]